MAKNWYVNTDGDITDGEQLIAEPNYLTKESYKNAHLLAAAPDLLAALQEVVRHLQLPCIYQPKEPVKMALAAIAKAQGAA